MKLVLENIGKIKEAAVEINGITVIAGNNNTGKSTVSKALYSVFNGFANRENQVRKEKMQTVSMTLQRLLGYGVYSSPARNNTRELTEYLVNNVKDTDNESIYRLLTDAVERYNEKFDFKIDIVNIAKDRLARLGDIFKVSDSDIFLKLFNHQIKNNFNGQINNLFSKEMGKISLAVKGSPIIITIRDNTLLEANAGINLDTEAIYIDNPFVVDEGKIGPASGARQYYNYRNHLRTKLFTRQREPIIINEIITNQKFNAIFEQVNLPAADNIGTFRRINDAFSETGNSKSVNLENLSTGIKTFIVIKTLLVNGTIQHNGTLILDEPEIHLHPEWQLLFAELLVLIQKHFNLHILLNTHSPYFLRAIQVYAGKNEIADKCKYYLAYLEGNDAYTRDVTDDIEQIYDQLAQPFQKLEDARWDDD
jgi:predicted ATPase